MYIDLLNMSLADVTPEVKFCFIKLVQQYCLDKAIEPLDGEVNKDEQQVLSGEESKPIVFIDSEETHALDVHVDSVSHQARNKLGQEENDKSLTGVRWLAFELGVSDSVLKETMAYLKVAGLIHVKSIAIRQGRHPSAFYWVEGKLRQLMKLDLPPPAVRHLALIENLLQPDRGTKGGANKPGHPLKLANRLLLMVLLSKADDCGAVRDISMTDLCKLSCLSRDRLESQLTKLKKEGYIRSHVPGLTGVTLFGCVKGAFFLNLRHDNYKDHAYSGITFLFKEEQLFDEMEFQEAKQIFRKARYFRGESDLSQEQFGIIVRRGSNQKRSVLNFDGEEPASEFHAKLPQISAFFKEDSFLSESAYLQMKLEEYASYLLTHRWREIGRDIEFIDEGVMQKIQNEILAPKLLKNKVPDLFPSDEQISRLYYFIYGLSLTISLNIKSMIALNPVIAETPISFCILPHPVSSNGYAIEAFFKSRTLGKAICLDLNNELGRRGFVRPAPRKESGMSQEERIFYGLLSPVMPDNGLWKTQLNQLKRDRGKHNKTQN